MDLKHISTTPKFLISRPPPRRGVRERVEWVPRPSTPDLKVHKALEKQSIKYCVVLRGAASCKAAANIARKAKGGKLPQAKRAQYEKKGPSCSQLLILEKNRGGVINNMYGL